MASPARIDRISDMIATDRDIIAGRTKICLTLRVDRFEAVAMGASSRRESFDLQNWQVDRDTNETVIWNLSIFHEPLHGQDEQAGHRNSKQFGTESPEVARHGIPQAGSTLRRQKIASETPADIVRMSDPGSGTTVRLPIAK